MKMVTKFWLLIFLLAAGIYAFLQEREGGGIEVSTNQAQAVSQTEDKPEPKGEGQEVVKVNTSQEFPAKRSLNFELSTYHNMKVKFNTTDSDKVIVSLVGEGVGYKNDGKRLADWYKVSSAGTTLKFKAFDKKFDADFSSLKDLARLFKGDKKESRLTMIIEFPEKHVFKNIKLQGVSNDIFATDVKFDSFKMATVSGDLRIKSGAGGFLKFETVSGDINVEVSGLKEMDMESVSGSAVVQSLNTHPEMEFNSVSGDLSLNIPSNSEVDVNFESMTGELINDFGVSKSSGKKLKFSSLSGSASINKIK